MEDLLDDLVHEEEKGPKDRHGCVTAWLILMIVANGLVALVYLFFGNAVAENMPGQPSTLIMVVLALLSILNVVFAVMLFQWKKLGFYGFVANAVIGFGINLAIGLGLLQSLFGLLGIAILYGIFQMQGKDGVSAWENLE